MTDQTCSAGTLTVQEQPWKRTSRLLPGTECSKETAITEYPFHTTPSRRVYRELVGRARRTVERPRWRASWWYLWSGLAVSVFLCGCEGKPDTFKPRIVITVPDGGGANVTRNFLISGYVLTDRGVKSISAQGVDLPVQRNGIKIQAFTFRTAVSGAAANYIIRAVDVSGNVSTRILPVRVDTVKPSIRSVKVEHAGTTLRVTGIVSDDQRVSQVLANGNRLNITPGPQVEFFVEAPGPWIDLQVIDAAGNTAHFRAQ